MVRLAPKNDQHRTKGDVLDLANKEAAKYEPQRRDAAAPSGSITVAQFYDSVYLPLMDKKNLSAATKSGYKKIWSQRLKDHFGTKALHDYYPRHAATYLDSLATEGLGRNTVAHIRAQMHSIFRLAASRGYINSNPIAQADPVVEPRAPEETEHYTMAEAALTLMALDSDGHARDHAIMALVFAGLRRAEVSGLMWSDIDYSASLLRVQRSAWMGIAGERPKNRKSKRIVALDETIINSLRRWQRLSTSKTGFVFENEVGKPIDLGIYSQRHLCGVKEEHNKFKRLGLVWRGFHSARRTAVTEMRGHGKSEDVARHFGHSVQVADELYDKGRIEETKRAAQGYFTELAAAISKAKRAGEDTRGHAN
jgi:integrase